MNKKAILGLGLCLVFFLGADLIAAKKRLKVMVSILPQVEFVKAIGGDHVEVKELIPKGFNPAIFEPSPRQLVWLSRSELYVEMGYLPFEMVYRKKIKNINKKLIFVTLSDGIKTRHMEDHDDHGHHHDHNIDPHTWLSPAVVKTQVKTIYKALAKLDPEHKKEYKKNYKAYLKKLTTLDRSLKKLFSAVDEESFLVFHPFMGYFCDRYGLHQIPIEVNGKTPTAKYLNKLMTLTKQQSVSVILTQRNAGISLVNTLARKLDLKILIVDPLDQNYISNLLELGKALSGHLGKNIKKVKNDD